MTEVQETQNNQEGVKVNAQPAVMRFTLEVTRAGTGKKETFECIGTPVSKEDAVKLDQLIQQENKGV